jgi:hypothetical protein
MDGDLAQVIQRGNDLAFATTGAKVSSPIQSISQIDCIRFKVDRDIVTHLDFRIHH